jgi:peptidoglycan/xylan/chitin deacetylase (PgdA/CDA1 family)
MSDLERILASLCLTLPCFGVPACEGSASIATAPPPARVEDSVLPETPALSVRPQLDGRAFPDKLVALTWDDGPDTNTLALASYLSRQHVSATFFVVREWAGGLSSDPGTGTNEFETGYEYLPILGDLVQLGHRVGNHTSNHVLLSDVGPEVADDELKSNQEHIDPFLTNELRLFRAPGGKWSARASRAMDADPYLVDIVGPIRWDIDRKDWENSLACRSSRPAAECEAGGSRHGSRVRPEVAAQRYLASIEAAGHGVVLFHDRVGDVGSTYALHLAEHLIPELVGRGFVFVAPVLGFVEAGTRLASPSGELGLPAPTRATLQLGDLDGDGRADVCVHAPGDRRCARSVELPGTAEDRRPRTVFEPSWTGSPAACAARFESEDIQLADVDGDGRADVCATMGFGVACALATDPGHCAPALKWSLWSDDARPAPSANRAVHFGDVDGDGRADVCSVSPRGIVCARSAGRAFGRADLWAAASRPEGDGGSLEGPGLLALADVDGDGRADACWRAHGALVCARSTGSTFGSEELWSREEVLTDAGELFFGDLNGDARADVCALAPAGVICALSTSRGFTRSSLWLASDASPEAARMLKSASLAMADVNGDRRADLCAYDSSGVLCALAP